MIVTSSPLPTRTAPRPPPDAGGVRLALQGQGRRVEPQAARPLHQDQPARPEDLVNATVAPGVRSGAGCTALHRCVTGGLAKVSAEVRKVPHASPSDSGILLRCEVNTCPSPVPRRVNAQWRALVP